MHAGHDLDWHDLARFLDSPGILDLSTGHALAVECFVEGGENVLSPYPEYAKLPPRHDLPAAAYIPSHHLSRVSSSSSSRLA